MTFIRGKIISADQKAGCSGIYTTVIIVDGNIIVLDSTTYLGAKKGNTIEIKIR